MRYFISDRIKAFHKLTLLSATALVLALFSSQISAMPSFTRQTGQPCNSCHTQSFGPNLTPFGREFKLGGYTMSSGSGAESKLPPISAMIMGSFVNTNKDQPDRPSGYSANNNFTFDEASLFYAGKIYGKLGAFIQGTYNGFEDILEMDNTDIRLADRLDLFDMPIAYGISLNNNPTVQDLWNTTPVWGFPYTGSGMQPGVGTSPLIDGGLGSQVGGATAYTLINNLLYMEAGAYGSFSSNFQRGFGIPRADRIALDGPAPYWRVALQHDWGGHYFALGHYGMSADVCLERDCNAGTDKFTDLAVDATYQYLANPRHIFEAKTSYIYEDQKLTASGARLGAQNTYLNTYKINAAYTFDQTYGVTLGYNKIEGSHAPDFSRPNSEYFTAELVYVPFGKANSLLSPWLNLRTSLQYIGYTQANGLSGGAHGNNTFMLNGWLAF